MRSPVALFVHSRYETTARVFERVAEAAPPILLIVADGPNTAEALETARCAAVRRLVTNPSWHCDVRVNASHTNLGLGRRFSSGLDWVFSQVDEAIILEDDCLPHSTFFRYCDELLEYFRNDETVMMISGDNYQFGQVRGDGSYFHSHGVGTYGWATWRRAFQFYDFAMQRWPAAREQDWLDRVWPVREARNYWRERFDATYRGEVDTWDYQWAFAMWSRLGLQVSPDRNLVSYIGCLPDAVHTTDDTAPYCSLPTEAAVFPLTHPSSRRRQTEADLYEFYRIFLNAPHDEAVKRQCSSESDADHDARRSSK